MSCPRERVAAGHTLVDMSAVPRKAHKRLTPRRVLARPAVLLRLVHRVVLQSLAHYLKLLRNLLLAARERYLVRTARQSELTPKVAKERFFRFLSGPRGEDVRAVRED